ncbi:MAG: hypothetical protein JW913_20335 [Chitinispirillaceae bacterium]|nr:hypothetical protein [Chitinispirillaceae bacterium]
MNSRFAASCLLLFVVYCAERIVPADSVYDPDNTGGDYRLEARRAPGGDTLCVFFPCTLYCSSSGDDQLTGYRCTARPAGCMIPSDGEHGFSEPLILRFIDTGACTLRVTGMRPNNLTVTASYPLTIVNPYRISVDSGSLLTGDSVMFRAVNTRCDTTFDKALDVQWRVDGDDAGKPLPFDSGFFYAVARPDTVTVSATVSYSSYKDALLDGVRIAVPEKRIPSVSIEDVVLASIGHPYTILGSMSNVDTLLWRNGDSSIDTATDTASLTFTWTDSTDDTIVVTAKNRFGTPGNSDTVYVQVRASSFALEFPSWPASVRARRTAVWEVIAKHGEEVIPDSQVTYLWTVTPDTAPDSMSGDGGRLILYFDDNPGAPVKVRVDAIVDTDTLTRTVDFSVIADKPVLAVVSADDSIGLGDTAVIVVRTRDTNGDGGIAGTYYRSEGDSAGAMDSDTLRIVGREPGEHRFEFWCVDDDGFSSPVMTVPILFTSSGPYFLRARDTITVYVDDSATITAAARAGNKGGTIMKWLWDFGADGSVERTTDVDHFDTLFTDTGSIALRVGCRDDRGDSAETLAVRVVNVSSGAPSVTSLAFTPQSMYRGDSVELHIVASDPNGTVDSLLIGTDSLSPRRIKTASRAAAIDTTFRLPMKTTGTFRFFAAVIDDDGRRSPWRSSTDSAIVHSGNPTVLCISPDTCWIFDMVKYAISASDPNGSVVSYTIQWDQGGAWETGTDSTVSHGYSSSGTKKVRVVATDNRGDMSDTLADSVVVKLGRPAVSTDSFPASVWINDTIDYTLSGGDPNGGIKVWAVRWSPDSAFEIRTSNGSFTHTFYDTGMQELNAFVGDSDDIASDTAIRRVYVKLGRPSICSITVVNPGFDSIFIYDTVSFTVKALDPNNENSTIRVSWDGSENFEPPKTVSGDSALFTRRFEKNGAVGRTIRFRVSDNDGLIDDSLHTVQVHRGAPTVTPIETIPSAGNIFVRDPFTFRIRAADGNGDVRKICINWKGGSAAQDSLMFGGALKSIDTSFTHEYDTTGGDSVVRVWAIDEDTVSSDTPATAITIRKGAPELWGDTLDTLWVVVDNGPKIEYPLQLSDNAYDTNGVNNKPVRYYINDGFPFDSNAVSAKKNSDGNFLWYVDEDRVNQNPKRVTFAVLDDDEFLRSDTFRVFADSAPVAPNPLNPVANADSVTLRWQNYDAKDGISGTHFTIYIDYASAPAPTTILQQDAGSLFDWDGSKYNFTFKPTSPSFSWKIITSDQRDTKSSSVTMYYVP